MSALPDAAAREQALDLGLHALVMAPAGSGKTGLLVQRMLAALATAEAPEEVVAITFTNKAAAEIRHRVFEALQGAAAGEHSDEAHAARARTLAQAAFARDQQRGWNLLQQPDRLRATTIDAFCAQIAAQLPLLSGLGGALRVSEDPRALYEEAIEALFAELDEASLEPADQDALRRVLRLANNRIDRLTGPLSELLARREQWLEPLLRAGEDAWARAEQQFLEQLARDALRGFCKLFDERERQTLLDILRAGAAHSDQLAWGARWSAWPKESAECLADFRQLVDLLLTVNGQLRKPGGITKACGFPPNSPAKAPFIAFIEARAGDAALEAAGAALRSLPDPCYPDDLRDLRDALVRVLRRLAAHLRVVFGRRGETDFGQIAQSAAAALRPDGAIGDALLAADRRIRHLLVDEMQDTSSAQIELLLQLTAGWTPGDGRSLFLVGDPQQSIYAFRKAEVRLFLKLWNERRLGQLVLTPLRLSSNFRSDPAVVDWFNDAFETIFPKVSDPANGVVAFTRSDARGERRDGAGVQLAVFGGGQAQAAADAAAAEAAERILNGSVVVLARARTHLEPVIRSLRARGLTPACQDVDPLAAQPAVRDLLALALALWHPGDRLSWAALLRAPFVGLSWADLVALSENRVRDPWPARLAAAAEAPLSEEGRLRVRRLLDALEASRSSVSLRGSLADRAEALWYALGGPGCVTRDELDDVGQALRCLRAHARGGGVDDLAALQRALAALFAAPRAGQVQLMTVHKAKGLEFDHVLLVGVNAKTRSEDRPLVHLLGTGDAELLVPRPPDAWKDDHPAHRLYEYVHARHVESRRAEALRLLYVALTRAKRSATLYLCAEHKADELGVLRPQFAAHSFAKLLEPVLLRAWPPPAAAAEPPAPSLPLPPRAPRLALDYRYAVDANAVYQPPERRTLRPSEAVLTAEHEGTANKRLAGGDIHAQLVGMLFHESLQKIAERGAQLWADGGEGRRPSLAAGLRRRGLPEPEVESAVQRVLDLVAGVLASERGRWLLAPRRWARNEYALAGWRDGRWISAVIDRCFEDDDGRLWIVDYKAAARPQSPEALDAYIRAGMQRYAGQVQEYVSLLHELRPGVPISGALYFAEGDRFEVVAEVAA